MQDINKKTSHGSLAPEITTSFKGAKDRLLYRLRLIHPEKAPKIYKRKKATLFSDVECL